MGYMGGKLIYLMAVATDTPVYLEIWKRIHTPLVL